MCGIAGIMGGKISSEELNRMGNAMIHRGPNGSGLWISEDKNLGFVHRRLSILDLSSSANQPMSTQKGAIQIIYNGEIYNHRALRLELQKQGFSFETDHSDTEVLLQGYLAYGLEGLLDKLQGMFAFALYDKRNKNLYLVRDRFGVKPLYYTFVKDQLFFASEIKALLSNPSIPRDLDTNCMHDYLSFRVVPAPNTLFKNISKLPAGHFMQISGTAPFKIQRWWHTVPHKGINPGEVLKLSPEKRQDFYVQGIRQRLKEAVVKRMEADVPVGVFLSGGIDSTSILALMAAEKKEPIHSFSVGFQDHPTFNELDFARFASKLYGSIHHEVLISDSDIIRFIDTLAYHQDEPLADWVCIPLYFLAELTQKTGIKVVQIGEGADEQFCGYAYYLKILKTYQRYWRSFQALPQALQKGMSYCAGKLSRKLPHFSPMLDMMHRAANQGEIFWTGAPVFWEMEKAQLLAHQSPGLDSAESIRSIMQPFDLEYPNTKQLDRMIYAEFQLRLPELLLMRVDKMTMANSVEARVPFLDHELVNFSLDIPELFKINGQQTKQILKSAVRGLIPDSIIDRPKQGFTAPMASWLRGSIGQYVKDRILGSKIMQLGLFNQSYVNNLIHFHQEEKRDFSPQIWNLFNLISWYDYWINK